MITGLTEGKPSTVLLKYSLPMLWSAMFQQLYNICDSIIAGKFAGEAALAAIGASYPVTQIFMAFALGSSVGASVVISQLFGAKRFADMKTSVNTAFRAFGVLSLILTAAGLFFSDAMLFLLDTPKNIFSDGSAYLQIYSAGLFFVFIYNTATGAFNGIGDSKTPLYLLIASSAANILLDLLFVAVLDMGVKGAAWATLIAQAAASVTAYVILRRRLGSISADRSPEGFSWIMLRKISANAVPGILQQSFVSVGNLFIQVLVNGFGSSVIAGYSAAIKLNTFAITSFTAMGNGLSGFTAQNVGAGRYERIPLGFRAGIAMVLSIAVPTACLYFFGGRLLLGLFLENGSDSAALETGMDFLRTAAPFYVSVCIKLTADGIQRGAGRMQYFMISTFSDLILRVIIAKLLVVPFGSRGIWMSWPIGWVISTVMAVIFYLIYAQKLKKSASPAQLT